MRHSAFIFYANPWMSTLITGGFILLLAAFVWFSHRKTIASDGLTPEERRSLPLEEREIISMLRQNGGPMRQDKIADIFPGDLEYFAEIIKAMETKSLLHRKWDSGLGTFLISTSSQYE